MAVTQVQVARWLILSLSFIAFVICLLAALAFGWEIILEYVRLI